MVDINDWNSKVIEDFRANGGKPGGELAGTSLLLLTTTGAKSGKRYINPLVYFPEGERLIICASAGGRPTNPDWYYNLVAHPQVTVEVGGETFEAKASVITGEERDRLYARQVELNPNFGEYQKNTTRVIPVIALVRQ